MTEPILIAGAGIAGLSAAMALARSDREIVVIDRDPPPPDLDPDQIFHHWQRKGVPQLRHSHIFIGRLVKLIREHHPRLWADLLAAGAHEFKFEDGLTSHSRDGYRAQPVDADLSFLFSRRTTLELVMRRYAESLPGVTFLTSAVIRGVSVESGNPPALTCLSVEVDGTLRDLPAGCVVDATGAHTRFSDWLGIDSIENSSPAGVIYLSRHYRLRDGMDAPPRDDASVEGDLGYLKFGIFEADNRHFSLTFACPEAETSLLRALVKPESFEAVCSQLPLPLRWTDPSRAEPVSEVLVMADLRNVWRRFAPDGRPLVLNLYPIGDAAVRTNPWHGRGCALAAIQAQILSEVFDSTAEPAARLIELERRYDAEIRPVYDDLAQLDARNILLSLQVSDDSYKPGLRERLMKSVIDDAFVPASRGDASVLRALMRSSHMLAHPDAWKRDSRVVARLLKVWATPKRLKRHLYPPSPGPPRAALLQALGLPLRS